MAKFVQPVAHDGFHSMLAVVRFLAPMLWIFTSGLAQAEAIVLSQSARTAGGFYRDATNTSQVFDANAEAEVDPAQSGRRFASGIGLALRQQRTVNQSEEELSTTIQSGGVTLNQNLGLNHSIAIGLRSTSVNSESGDKKLSSANLKYTAWPFIEKLRLGIGYGQTKQVGDSIDYTDIDGKRVITLSEVGGRSVSLEGLLVWSPETFVTFDWTHSTRDDRPAADIYGLQWRRYFIGVDGALHLAGQFAENVGTIRPVTTYGRVVAASITSEWHQKIYKQWIAMAGWRTYIEEETPRAMEADRQVTGSDYVYLSGRYRLRKSWTLRSSELSFMYGRYISNQQQNGQMVSLGFLWNS